MGAQPDTSTSAPDVWHGIQQILAQIPVAAHLATYLEETSRGGALVCMASVFRLRLPFLICGQALLLAATLALYAVAPIWIAYRGHASRLQEDDVPGLSQTLHALVRHAGLRRAPLSLVESTGSQSLRE